jgi:hypothetical protein
MGSVEKEAGKSATRSGSCVSLKNLDPWVAPTATFVPPLRGGSCGLACIHLCLSVPISSKADVESLTPASLAEKVGIAEGDDHG